MEATYIGRPAARSGMVLGIILAGYLMFAVDTSIVNVALPTLRSALHFSTVGLSWVVNAYMLAYGGLLFLGGRSGDIVGRRRSLVFGIGLFSAASALGGLAPSGAWLIAARVLQGLGAAFAAPSTMALLVTSFPEGPARNRALSTYSASASLGAIIGLVLGGALTQWLSWRWVFFVNVPIGLALLALAPRFLPETERREGRFDLPGAVTGTAAVAVLVHGMIRAASNGWGDPFVIGSLTAAAALLTFFIRHERTTKESLLPLHLFADRNRIGAYFGFLLIIAGNYGTFFFATQFLQRVLGFSPVQTGLAYVPLAATILVTVRIVPRLLTTWSPRALLLAGTPMQAASLFWLSRLSPTSGYLDGILGPMVLLGLAAGLCVMPLNATALAGVERKEAGAASGLAQTMMIVGGSLGLSILVTIFGSTTRTGAVPTSLFAHSVTTTLSVAAGFAATAFLVALFVLRAPLRVHQAVKAEANKNVVRRYLEMWNTGNVEKVHEILHPQWRDHAHQEIRSAGDVPAVLLKERADAPDFHIGVETIVSEGDRVAVHSTIRRTLNGNPQVSRVMWLVRIEGDKMAEMWTALEQSA